LTWYGITVYGTIDAGGGWLSHGTPLSRTSAPGQDYLIQKNSNRALWGLAPNGLSQSNIGIKGNETIAPGWAFVFDLEAGFDPYSLQLANGPHSIAQNIGVPLTSQNGLADSSRAGQFYNSVGYLERHEINNRERTAGCLPDRSRAPRCPTGASRPQWFHTTMN